MMEKKKNIFNKSEIYDSFIEMSVEGMLIIDKNKIIRLDNPSAEKILGYNKGELNNKNIFDLIPLDQQLEFDNLCEIFLKSEKHTSGVRSAMPFFRKNKKIIYTEISLGNHIHSKEGSLMIVVFSDISQKIKVEKELKNSVEQFSLAFHKSPAPSAITRFVDGQYKDVNKSFLAAFGYKREEVVGKTSLELDLYKHCGENERKKIVEFLKNDGRVRDFDITLNKSTGEPIDVVFSAEIIQLEGENYIFSTMIDTTEKRKTEKILREYNETLEQKVKERTIELTQALEREKEINELKSRFVTMASHEFRTPLASLLSSASILEKYTDALNNEKLTKHFNRIRKSVSSLTEILNYFILLEDIEKGRGKIENSKFNLDKMMKDIIKGMKVRLKTGQVITYKQVAGDADLFQDEVKVREIFINLISNAIKYSAENSKIDLTTNIKDSDVIFTIKDKGIGIPEKDQKNIFALFFRAKNAQIIEGTGLGLNIVKKYLELIGGSINFTSNENEGSCFTVIFPINASKVEN